MPRTSHLGVASSLALALPLCLLLSACGGDGSYGVASTPPPPVAPKPTPAPSPALPAGTTTYNYPASHPVDVRTNWLDSPATRLGTTDVIGRLTITPGNGGPTSSRTTAAGEFTITTTQPSSQQSTWGNLNHQYALNAPVGLLPGGLTSIAAAAALSSWDINDAVAYHYPDNPYGDTLQYFGQHLAGFATDGSGKQLFAFDYSRTDASGRLGLSPNQNLQITLGYDVGYSYVAMGEWSWGVVDLQGKAAGDSGHLLFVNGDRTPSSGIPVSGTATYDARTFALLSSGGTAGIPFTLSADFGSRTISTQIDQDYRYDSGLGSGGEPILGIHVGGSAPFTNAGMFDIPLAGTASYSAFNSSVTPAPQSVTGMMNGAFFGPHAEQVGGTFSLQNTGGVLLMQVAFVGKQH